MKFSLLFCWNGYEGGFANSIFWAHSGKNIFRCKLKLNLGAKTSIFGHKTRIFDILLIKMKISSQEFMMTFLVHDRNLEIFCQNGVKLARIQIMELKLWSKLEFS